MGSKVDATCGSPISGWLRSRSRFCRQRLIAETLDRAARRRACAHHLLDGIGRFAGCAR